MNENKYGIVWDDDPDDLLEDEELDVDEVPGAEELEEAAPVEPAVDEPPSGRVTYTRGPNGRLVQL